MKDGGFTNNGCFWCSLVILTIFYWLHIYLYIKRHVNCVFCEFNHDMAKVVSDGEKTGDNTGYPWLVGKSPFKWRILLSGNLTYLLKKTIYSGFAN